MSHARKTVRDQAVAVLTGLSFTGSNVFASRTQPLYDSVLPCILISTTGEEIETIATGGGLGQNFQTREIALVIKAITKAVDTAEDDLDAICVEIEFAMANYVLSSFKNKRLDSTKIFLSQEGDQPIATATMNYIVTVNTRSSTPDTII